MKKIVAVGMAFIFGLFSLNSQTAVNFNANDCAGNNHDLFTELDAGKIIVLVWVMPCAVCIGPAIGAGNTVKTYTASHPEVKYYLADDLANTTCATLGSWATTNGIANATKFSDAGVNETGYGATGMPHIVVLSGKNHLVYGNQRDVLDVNLLKQSIDAAIAANSSTVTGLKALGSLANGARLFPNPSNNLIHINFELSQISPISIEIINELGITVKSILAESPQNGTNTYDISLDDISINGIYFLSLNIGDEKTLLKFAIQQ
ncbi:MAG: T9SS type A sorting domain-containing protein [bacterium]|nr:T9SS type A sorting domain-containing protein [bacterium]